MSAPAGPRHKTLFLALAAVLAVWGVLGALDIPNQPYSGYSTGSDFEVTGIAADGPAAAAGLVEGDRIVSIAGVSVGEAGALADLPRAGIGETRSIVVDRDGQQTTVDLTYGSPTSSSARGSYFTLLIGAAFLFLGLWAYLKAPHAGTLLLVVLGCLLGPALLSGPYVPPGALTTVMAMIAVSGIVLGFAVLLDFVLRSGRANGYTSGGGGPRWLYWPALLIAVMLAGLNVLQPDFGGALSIVFQVMFGGFFLFYFTGSLVMVIRNHRKADPTLREARGLGLMLAGALIGLAPLTVAFVASLLPGNVTIPGAEYLAFTLVAVPVTFSLAAVKGGGTHSPEDHGVAPAL